MTSGGEPADERAAAIAPGTDFLGAYRGSGMREPPHLVRRRDGQVLQLSPLLALVAEELARGGGLDAVAAAVRARSGRPVQAADVRYLVDRRLRPMGLIAEDGGAPPALPSRPHAFLALRFRRPLVPARAAGAAGDVLAPLFAPALVVCALLGLVALDAWLVAAGGLGTALHEAIDQPAQLLAVAGLVIVAGAVHELGHAAACRRGGARPGAIGVGIYLIWPAFYTDVTDAYRLDRAGRLRVDLGGLYLNVLFLLALGALYAVTGWPLLLLAIVAVHLEMLDQFMPWLRLDGYYVVSDLAGVPDLFSRLGPVLRSLLPGRHEPRARELTGPARMIVTAWVLTAVPVLIALLAVVALNAPEYLPALWASARAHAAALADAPSALGALAAGVELAVLAVPLIGGALATGVVARRLARRGRPL